MAFGYKTTTGDFLPIVKFDARSGRFFKVNKEFGGVAEDVEIPNGTKFAIDFGTLEAGWVTFGAQGPIRHMRPYVEEEGTIPQPQDKDGDGKLIFRPGFYTKICGNALDGVREWIGASAAVMNAMEELYQACIRTPEMAKGQIPIVIIARTTAIKSGMGARSSTNYGPVFEVAGFTDRPNILGPRTVPVPRPSNGAGSALQQEGLARSVTQATPAPTAVVANSEMPW